MIDDSNRLLMSDSIKGMVPELEDDQIEQLSDSYVMTTFQFLLEGTEKILGGSLVGISLENLEEIKLDVRVNLGDAYDIIKKYVEETSRLSCGMFYMHLGDSEIPFSGPFEVSRPKIHDFDHQNKMCTLGVDLIKR
jgi:hypothetical protein